MREEQHGRARVGDVKDKRDAALLRRRDCDHPAARHAQRERLRRRAVLGRAAVHRLAERTRARPPVAAVIAALLLRVALVLDVLLEALVGGGVVQHAVHRRVLLVLLAVVRPREGGAPLALEERPGAPHERHVSRGVD